SRMNVVVTGLFLALSEIHIAAGGQPLVVTVDKNWACLQALCVMNIAAGSQLLIVAVEYSSSAVDI
ncbi:hypothetical protein Tco_1573485, partial [Tanacetum coccineum]